MRLTYAAQARVDLEAISDYLEARSPAGAERVALCLRRSIERLTHFPMSGRLQSVQGVRRIVEPTYSYLIYYAVAPDDDEIVVLAVRHSSRKRMLEDE